METDDTELKGKVDLSIATVRKDIIGLKELHFQQLFNVHRAARTYIWCTVSIVNFCEGSSYFLDDLVMFDQIA